MTNEEKKAARRKRRAELGQDLFSTQARASRRILPANSPGEFSRRILSAHLQLFAEGELPLRRRLRRLRTRRQSLPRPRLTQQQQPSDGLAVAGPAVFPPTHLIP